MLDGNIVNELQMQPVHIIRVSHLERLQDSGMSKLSC